MPLAALLTHVDRDDRRRARIAAGSVMARYAQPGDLSYVGASTFPHQAIVKPRGVSIPEGVVVVATRRDAHGRCTSIMVEAFEGDAAGFASFPRLAHMLGATELHLITRPGTMLDRLRTVRDLASRARCDRAALLSRPLAVGGQFDRAAIMATACAAARARQGVTGEAWGVCLSATLTLMSGSPRKVAPFSIETPIPAAPTVRCGTHGRRPHAHDSPSGTTG